MCRYHLGQHRQHLHGQQAKHQGAAAVGSHLHRSRQPVFCKSPQSIIGCVNSTQNRGELKCCRLLPTGGASTYLLRGHVACLLSPLLILLHWRQLDQQAASARSQAAELAAELLSTVQQLSSTQQQLAQAAAKLQQLQQQHAALQQHFAESSKVQQEHVARLEACKATLQEQLQQQQQVSGCQVCETGQDLADMPGGSCYMTVSALAVIALAPSTVCTALAGC